MALIQCHECKKDVSTEAKNCPSCGAKVIIPVIPKVNKTSKFTKVVIWFMGIGLFGTVMLTMFGAHPANSTSNSSITAAKENPPLNKEVVEKLHEFKILKKDHDKIGKVSFYHDKSEPDSNDAKYIGAYIGWNDGDAKPYLRFKLSYSARDWLFISKFTIDADGQQFEYGKVFERDNQATIWEWIDEPATKDIEAMLSTISLAKKVTVRFTGKQYHDDFIVPQKQKIGIANVLKALKAARGTL